MDSNAPYVHPLHALAVYAESIVGGARVAVFADSSIGLGTKLMELGARTVHVWDPDVDRAADEANHASRGVVVRPYSEQDPDVRPIDLAIIADLGIFADPGAIVRRVRRMVGEEGVALVAAKSAEAARDSMSRPFDYYDLFDLVAPEFESVRMVGQLPFHGVALVELGEDEESPSVSVDTQLAESGRGPEVFVVVASQHGARLEPYAIVQLPSPISLREPLHEAAGATLPGEREIDEDEADERDDVDDDERDRVRERESDRADLRVGDVATDALTQAQIRAELLASQLEEMRARAAEAERAADAVAVLEETLRARSSHVVELEKTLSARGRELGELSSEVEEMRAAADAGRIAAAQVEEVARRADRAERRLAGLEQELSTGVESQSRELFEMEQLLRERAQTLRGLEVELARRDQMVRDLVGTLDEHSPREASGAAEVERERAAEPEAAAATPTPGHEHQPATRERDDEAKRALVEENASLRAQLDALALDLARREGDAHASAWQISELERQLAELRVPPPEASSPRRNVRDVRDVTNPHAREAGDALAQALDELDSLRAALTQEHEARARAESGEELARARAEIERQAVLMEQLVGQLDARRHPEHPEFEADFERNEAREARNEARNERGLAPAGEAPSGSSDDSR
jgi:hypothetical protein